MQLILCILGKTTLTTQTSRLTTGYILQNDHYL